MYDKQIRIGTLAGMGKDTAAYIRQILPYGFESFSINFWQSLNGVDLPTLAGEVKEVLAWFEGPEFDPKGYFTKPDNYPPKEEPVPADC